MSFEHSRLQTQRPFAAHAGAAPAPFWDRTSSPLVLWPFKISDMPLLESKSECAIGAS